MMLVKVAAEHLTELAPFFTQLAARQLGQNCGVGLATDQGGQNLAAGYPQNVADHRGQLDPGVLQHLLQAVGHAGVLISQTLAQARQIAQFANRLGWNEAGPQQTVLQQLGQPHAILDIGLAPRHLLDMGRVYQQHLHRVLQGVVHRLPVHPGSFHRRDADPLRLQPLAQLHQTAAVGAEGAHFLVHLGLLRHSYAGAH